MDVRVIPGSGEAIVREIVDGPEGTVYHYKQVPVVGWVVYPSGTAAPVVPCRKYPEDVRVVLMHTEGCPTDKPYLDGDLRQYGSVMEYVRGTARYRRAQREAEETGAVTTFVVNGVPEVVGPPEAQG